jgi:predicted acyl esterase
MDRPFHEVQDICLRWYDHWLKGIDTGIMDEPPILIFVQGINKWRYENEWPLRVTNWTKFYLRGGGQLSTNPPENGEDPQVFTSDPWANPTEGFHRADTIAKADPIPKAIYETERLKESVEMTGPIALYWYASIESNSIQARSWKGSPVSGIEVFEPLANYTDWYLKIRDIDVDGSERCMAEGWLKASHYELDESKSKAYSPYHPHTRSLPVEPDQVILYASDLRMTSNVFFAGHKIRLEIAAQDQVQAIWYHLPHMANVKHTIFNSKDYPSYLLLPVIPEGYNGAGEPTYPPAGPF